MGGGKVERGEEKEGDPRNEEEAERVLRMTRNEMPFMGADLNADEEGRRRGKEWNPFGGGGEETKVLRGKCLFLPSVPPSQINLCTAGGVRREEENEEGKVSRLEKALLWQVGSSGSQGKGRWRKSLAVKR